MDTVIAKQVPTSKTLSQLTAQPNDSPFWKSLVRTKVAFFNRGKFIIGDGCTTRFWEDWLALGVMLLAL